MEAELTKVFSNYQGRREEIIPLLQGVQEELGYLPDEAMQKIARFTKVPASNVYAVATFYAQFRFEPLGKNHILVCRGTACHVRGAQAILEEMIETLGLEEEGTTEDQEFTIETVACIGCCALAPVITVNEEVHGNLTKNQARKVLKKGGQNGR
jgi:NADH-quinone oxidoreductase subunit E